MIIGNQQNSESLNQGSPLKVPSPNAVTEDECNNVEVSYFSTGNSHSASNDDPFTMELVCNQISNDFLQCLYIAICMTSVLSLPAIMNAWM